MQLFINQVINGLGQGVVFASVALALVLIFRTTGVLNFAQGEMALFSAFVSWKLTTTGMPVVVAILLSMAFSFVAGAVIERTLIRPMEGRSPLNVVIITLGLFLGINALVQLIFGTDPQTMPSPFPRGSVPFILDTRIQKDTIGLLLVLLVQCLGLWLLLNRTTIGLKLRAVAANPDSARLHGIRAGTMLMFGWGLSAAIGALAGTLVAGERTAIDASLMQVVLVYALASAALGGFGSVWGAVVAGLFVGVADSLTKQYVDALDGIEVVLPLGLILVVLVVMPNGLFGKRTVERV
ncbi:MAG TPA: branched-chain amino acid ABC transporter permease [Acidimicrobiales bacterium]|nr:branched-chain amino acid ABC transporter permease [Acidimicrobiales bacterium]